MHGFQGKPNWAAPKLVASSDEAGRADQGNNIKANEYLDDPKVLDKKIEVVADMIKKSKCLIAYTGAGLSQASGIPDYATKAKNSVVAAPQSESRASWMDANPTYAHCVLTAMEKAGYIKWYIQQNHDGYV